MDILVLNSGSSSLKFELIETSWQQIEENSDRSRASGAIEKIGLAGAEIHFESGEDSVHDVEEILDHRSAMKHALRLLKEGPLEGELPDAVGHRVVHGGESLHESVEITQDVETEIEKCVRFAPLHNPHNLMGIRAARESFPDLPHVAAFDTGVYKTLPKKAYLYAIPRNFYHRHGIRKYGFHGLGHRYLRFRTAQLLDRPKTELDLLTLHLGNGSSITAFEQGKAVDTSMGFTPLEGLVMGTRCGDMDPAVVFYLMATEHYTPHDIEVILNKQSGLLGLSGVNNDMEQLLEEAEKGHQACEEAIDVYCHRLKKYIGSYQAVVNGADALLFSAGIGENAAEVRRRTLEGLDNIGIKLDHEANEEAVGKEMKISAEDSSTEVWVVPTDEEMVIARDTFRCLNPAKG